MVQEREQRSAQKAFEDIDLARIEIILLKPALALPILVIDTAESIC